MFQGTWKFNFYNLKKPDITTKTHFYILASLLGEHVTGLGIVDGQWALAVAGWRAEASQSGAPVSLSWFHRLSPPLGCRRTVTENGNRKEK